MKKFKKLIIACDGESASGKSTAAKLISRKYKLLLINSGLLYRYAIKEIIKNNPKDIVNFLKKRFKRISYKKIVKLKNSGLSDNEIVQKLNLNSSSDIDKILVFNFMICRF